MPDPVAPPRPATGDGEQAELAALLAQFEDAVTCPDQDGRMKFSGPARESIHSYVSTAVQEAVEQERSDANFNMAAAGKRYLDLEAKYHWLCEHTEQVLVMPGGATFLLCDASQERRHYPSADALVTAETQRSSTELHQEKE